MMDSEVIAASQVKELGKRIHELRDPEAHAAFKKELANYKRRLSRGGHKEVWTTIKKKERFGTSTRQGYGYVVIGEDGHPEAVARPTLSLPVLYGYSGYNHAAARDGSPFGHARTFGLLADPKFNRDIRYERVAQYADEMLAGRWRDLLTDPIGITAEGQVVNGQHRLAAVYVAQVEAEEAVSRGRAEKYGGSWPREDNDPKFLVIWNVDPTEAQYADGSRRTQKDEKVIADKVVASLTGGE
jgi:hypothetical protein